jgi:hypothetical protein
MWLMVFVIAVRLEHYREVWDVTYCVWYCHGTELVFMEGLRWNLWCLVLRWDLNIIGRVWDGTYGVWYCGDTWSCVIGRVWDVTYGVWYCGGTWTFIVGRVWDVTCVVWYFVGTWTGISVRVWDLTYGVWYYSCDLNWYYREVLKCDLWCLVLR